MTPKTINGMVVGYVRVSTDKQARDGQSLKAQESCIRSYASSLGLEVDSIYRENGSGKDTERPALAMLRNNLAAIGVVIVYKFDRISRSVVDLYQILQEFETEGVAFQSVSEGVNTCSPVGKFVTNILAGLAQMERELIAERTRDTLAKMQESGKHVGKVPFGYRRDEDGCLEKDPEQQRLIVRMKRMHRSGVSHRSIARVFGIPKSTVGLLVNSNGNSRNARFVKRLPTSSVQ